MLDLPPLFFGNDGGTSQKEVARPIGAIDMMPYRIPELRDNLPFVYESRRVSNEQGLDVDFGEFNDAGTDIRVGQIEDAFGKLLACRGFSAPLRPLDKDGPHALKLA